MAMFKEVADIKTADMLNLPVPEAEYHNVSVEPSEMQKEMVASLAERAEKVRGGGVDSSVDNMLKITNDGRKLALDQRMLNAMLPDFENSKINACVDNVYRIWEISMGAVRTVAVQVSEELFQRLKVVIGKKHMKQKDFLIQIIEEALEKVEVEWQSKEQPEESEQTTGELGTEETQPEERTEPERESEPEEEAEPDGESEPKEENKPEGESEPEEETEPEGETDPEESKAEEPTEW